MKDAKMLLMCIVQNTDITEQSKVKEENIPMQKLLKEFADIFAPLPAQLPPRRKYDHSIKLVEGAEPPYKSLYQLSLQENNILHQQLKELLEKGWIQPSQSPYGAPVLFVKKKDGTLYMCIDYRALNSVTIKNCYPLPHIDELLERVSGAKIFSKIDLANGYHQIRMAEEDEEKTAFRTCYGHYQFRVMPFRLTNAPATFMNLMNTILAPFLDKSVLVFLDNILIYSKSPEEHVKHVREVLEILQQHQLFVRKEKCEFAKKEVEYLGFLVGVNGVGPEERKTKIIKNWKQPTTVADI